MMDRGNLRIRSRRRALASGALAAAVAFTGCAKEEPPKAKIVQAAPDGLRSSSSTGSMSIEPKLLETKTQPVRAPLDSVAAAAAWKQGVALFQQRDYARASELLQDAASGRRDDAYGHYLLGLALWKSGQPEDAARALERAAELAPASPRTWVNLARVRMDLEQPEKALEAADRAVSLSGTSADALHQRGRALAALGRGDDALEALRLAHESDPSNGWVANTLGYLLIQRGRVDEAVAPLEAARERLPEVAFVRNNLGVAYERSGRIAEALEEYRAAVAIGGAGGKALASVTRLEPVVSRAGTASSPAVAALPPGQ